jgi:hypothetical protein
MQTQLAVTAYDKFYDVDEGNWPDDSVVAINNIFSGQKYYIPETKYITSQNRVGLHYLIAENVFESELLSGLDKFKFPPNTPITGLTYLSSYIPSTIVKLEPEQEIEFSVKMYPTATLISRGENYLSTLHDLYEFDYVGDEERFIKDNKRLINFLMEAPYQIKKICGKDIKINLHFDRDDEEDYASLFIIIKTRLSADENISLLDRIDNEWWLKADYDIRKAISIDVDS